MTLSELYRSISAKKRMEKFKMQQRAMMDYTLADLIGRSISRLYSQSANLPSVEEAYSFLFDEESKKELDKQRQKQHDELSAMRFKLFAESFNKKFKGVQKD